MEQFKGKTTLIVNTATDCQFTKQYAEMEFFYREYKDKGFHIIAFPSGNFGHSSGNTEAHIEFCKNKFDITFTIALKCHVNKEPLPGVYEYLRKFCKNEKEIDGDFEKFLLLKNGNILNFSPQTTISEFKNIIIEDLG